MQNKSVGKKHRTPKCALCKAHGYAIALKGHKQCCPWQNCNCTRCELIKNKRLIMAAQIRLRREQIKNELQMEPLINPFEMSKGSNWVKSALCQGSVTMNREERDTLEYATVHSNESIRQPAFTRGMQAINPADGRTICVYCKLNRHYIYTGGCLTCDENKNDLWNNAEN